MTSQQKADALAWLEKWIAAADKAHLPQTAQSWRDYAERLRERPASEIICSRAIASGTHTAC